MNVFEDLIVELKQENLLERSVIDDQLPPEDTSYLDETVVPDRRDETPIERFGGSDVVVEMNDELAPLVEVDDDYTAHLEETVVPDKPEPVLEPQIHRKPRNGQEFYRKRAISEVSNLQMVEHVLTGVEREYMKLMPRTFDDFQAKKALNTFLQVTENENSTEHKEAEFQLMTETEAWCTALATRDKDISVGNLRLYCEGSRPPLSSQALVALARFYRNLPYSSAVRSKFDFAITRLFSRAVENEMRVALFNREESLAHIKTLYRDWSSIALYETDEFDSNISLAAASFEDLANEADKASSFDRLIAKDFFARVRNFKDSIGALFFAPSVLAAAIEANVRIGNAYVRLIAIERQKLDASTIELKYGNQYDDSVAEGIGRTLELVDLLKAPLNISLPVPVETPEAGEPDIEASAPEPLKSAVGETKAQAKRPALVDSFIASIYSMNRWLLIVCGILVAASVGIYVYANFFATEKVVESDVRAMSIDDPIYKDYVTTGRVTDETFYGVLLPSWDSLSTEKKEEIVTYIYSQGKDKGYRKVNLIGPDGKAEAFASPARVEVRQK